MSSKKSLIEEINNKFGNGAIITFGDGPIEPIDVISTGISALDEATGIGGLPKGRIVEIYGPTSAGKSTLALHVIAEAQKTGNKTAYIDTEFATDLSYCKNLGVEIKDMILCQPSSAQDALEIMDMMVRSGEVDLIVLDSVAALASREELEGEMGDSTVGLVARLMGQAMRKLVSIASQNKCLIIFINQLRSTIGGYGYGEQVTTTGGKALPYASTIRMEVKRIGPIKGTGDKIIGNKTKIKIVKNKVAAPWKEVDCEIVFGEGVSKESDLLEKALVSGVFIQKGGWFSYNGANIAQGKDKLRQLLKDEDFANEINERIKEENIIH